MSILRWTVIEDLLLSALDLEEDFGLLLLNILLHYRWADLDGIVLVEEIRVLDWAYANAALLGYFVVCSAANFLNVLLSEIS